MSVSVDCYSPTMGNVNFGDERLPARFWDKVQTCPMSGCWRWTASVAPGGYGHIKISGRLHRAHRFAYEALVGPIPQGLVLDHLCRVTCCVNPEHLEPVTGAENTRRGDTQAMSAAGRAGLRETWVARREHMMAIVARRAEAQKARTHCKRGHEYSADNVEMVRGARICITCRRERKAQRRHEIRALRAA